MNKFKNNEDVVDRWLQQNHIDAECFRFFVSALVADIAGEEFTPQQRMLKSLMNSADALTLETARGICIASMEYVGDLNG